MKLLSLITLHLLTYSNVLSQGIKPSEVDVLSYEASIAPNFSQRSIKGKVAIKFKTALAANRVVFEFNNLKINNLYGSYVSSYKQGKSKVIVWLKPNKSEIHEVNISYQGAPKQGVVFLKNPSEVYSVYFTSHWMVCNMNPADKATLKLNVVVPKGMTCVASGVLKSSTTQAGNKVKFSWQQDYATPAYTYGFVVGAFDEVQDKQGNTLLKYYSNGYTLAKMKQIFQYTGDMVAFFEDKTGIPLPQKTYSQVLVGHHYQEMSGFAVLKKSYGTMVLQDSTETNLFSHELAHQWWGNMITCQSWRHFWLNEGFATFMSAAYNERRFGKKKYQENIQAYFKVYQRIKARGNDKPLVFKNWWNPSRDDRNLVYFKGAYVLHLLRQELGEAAFWKGIKHYSKTYYGKSVTTQDFQLAMEKSSGKSLKSFFDKWVY